MHSFGKPTLVVGGGGEATAPCWRLYRRAASSHHACTPPLPAGYTIRNVSRCWAFETAVILGNDKDLPDDLPPTPYYEYYGPEYKLHIPTSETLQNANSRADLELVSRCSRSAAPASSSRTCPCVLPQIRNRVIDNLGRLQAAPNGGFGQAAPGDFIREDVDRPAVKDEPDQEAGASGRAQVDIDFK